MNQKIEARNFKGTRDYLPNEMIQRNRMIQVIRGCFEKYGFVPIETPALEYLDILMGKYGEEGDKLIYRLDYKGGHEVGMKYDLTVPFTRVIAQHQQLIFPFKRYQIQPVWRADRPQPKQGRFREFYQCDADVVGVSSLVVDAEVIAMTSEILSQLNIGRFVIRVNHRKILKGITQYIGLTEDKEVDLCRGIDKLDKIGIDDVKKELRGHGFSDAVMDKLFHILSLEGDSRQIIEKLAELLVVSDIGMEGVVELRQIFDALDILNVPKENLKLDLYLARGLDYYTGAIYESASLELPHVGSLTGGGRYDNLIGAIRGVDTPAVGSTIGLDRIYTVLKQLNVIEEKDSLTQVLVTLFNDEMVSESLKLTSILRKNSIATEMIYEPQKLKKQFGYADKKKIPYVLVLGPDEAEKGIVTIKDLSSGTQQEMGQEKIITYLKEKIER